MSSLKDLSVSFIVRVWREPTQCESEPTQWRGSIEEVESGDRIYFTDLAGMLGFVRVRVAQVGIDVGSVLPATPTDRDRAAPAARAKRPRRSRE